MTYRVVIQGLSDSERQAAIDHWSRRCRRLERLLTPFLERSIRLTVQVESPNCEVHAILMLPTATLTGRGRGPAEDPALAIDEAADSLAAEIRAHKATLRREFLHHRRRRRRGDLSGILPVLEERRAVRDKDTFIALLRPALRELSDHARRELTIAQLEGVVAPGEVTVSGLLSDLIARVWDKFDERPKDQRLELWLTALLHAVIDEHGAEPSAAVKQTVVADRAHTSVESGPAPELVWPLAESLTLDAVVPIAGSGSVWERTSDEEQRTWILSQLRGFTREQRRAFTLYILEGWNDDEIASLQGRRSEEVLLDVERVRDALIAGLEEARSDESCSREVATRPAARRSD